AVLRTTPTDCCMTLLLGADGRLSTTAAATADNGGPAILIVESTAVAAPAPGTPLRRDEAASSADTSVAIGMLIISEPEVEAAVPGAANLAGDPDPPKPTSCRNCWRF